VTDTDVLARPTGDGAPDEVWLWVGGMTCGSCAARLESRLNALEGVDATVNYASGRAHVRTSVPTSQLVREVREAGFTAAPVTVHDRLREELRVEADRRARSLGARLIVAALLFMPLCDASIGFSLVPNLRFTGWQWVLLVMALPVVTWCAWPFYTAAVRQARHGITTMDTLASIGILTATGWSLYAMFALDTAHGPRAIVDVLLHQAGGALYLDVAAGVTTFLLAGRYVEARSRRRAVDALGALAAVGTKEVSVLEDDGAETMRSVDELVVGDRFVVRSGETVAADGEVVSGRAVLDRSSMTGESIPTEVGPGDRVIGGTVAVGGRLVVQARAVGAHTQLAQMLHLVERAQSEKASVQRLADRIAGVFVPAVLVTAVVTLVAWLVAGADPERAVNAALSVVIIACPCALGLATPMALLMASDRGARSGIFFKRYEAIELSGRIDTVLFDKTGTITDARMSVVGVAAAPGCEEGEVVRLAASLERASEHPIGRAIAAFGGDGTGVDVEDFRALAGVGARGTVAGHDVSVGSLAHGSAGSTPATVPDELKPQVEQWLSEARTVVRVSRDGAVVGAIALADSLRPGAADAVSQLHSLGLRCVLLTGDNARAAAAVAARCGLESYLADVSPQDKSAAVARLQRAGHRVAVVGDGVNDGPALAQADLGLALGSGTDVARNSADLLVVRDDLRAVPAAIRLAQRTHVTIRRNLAWAFGYNIVAIPLAACGLLDPLIAAAAMALSSGFVVWNSARLHHFSEAMPEGRGEP
jgi:P-type Cu+ transporter